MKIKKANGSTVNVSAHVRNSTQGFLPPKVEDFLVWVAEQHGKEASDRCRQKLTDDAMQGRSPDPVGTLNEFLYSGKSFSRPKVGKIKFVV